MTTETTEPAPMCPGGCGCRLGTDDADRSECGCDSGCCETPAAAGSRRIYLAARYSRNAEMRGVRDVLEALGHKVTSRWIEDLGGKYGKGSFTPGQLNSDPEYCTAVARRDVEDVTEADTMISFTSADGGGKGGRHVEFGLAIGLGLRLVVVGPREHVFHTLPDIEWHPDWAHLVMAWSPVFDGEATP